MKPNEILLRLSYLNVTFKGLTTEADNPDSLTHEDLLRLRQEALNHAPENFDELIAQATKEFGENVATLLRAKDLYAKRANVPVSKVCFDDGHESYGTFHNVVIQRGNLLTDFYEKHKDNPDIQKSVTWIRPRLDFFHRYIPIVVKEYGDTYEVAEGNHRVFAAIANGDTSVPVLIASKKVPECPITNLNL